MDWHKGIKGERICNERLRASVLSSPSAALVDIRSTAFYEIGSLNNIQSIQRRRFFTDRVKSAGPVAIPYRIRGGFATKISGAGRWTDVGKHVDTEDCCDLL